MQLNYIIKLKNWTSLGAFPSERKHVWYQPHGTRWATIKSSKHANIDIDRNWYMAHKVAITLNMMQNVFRQLLRHKGHHSVIVIELALKCLLKQDARSTWGISVSPHMECCLTFSVCEWWPVSFIKERVTVNIKVKHLDSKCMMRKVFLNS